MVSSQVDAAEVERTREASRRLVRRLGFMEEGLAGSGLPASAVHALIEIGAAGRCTARELADLLVLEKSSVSRMLRKLVDRGLVEEGRGAADGRTKPLSLTAKGEATAAALHDFARRQVSQALARLGPRERATVTAGLGLYAQALAAPGTADADRPLVTIEAGYRPGALGCCAELHARHYARASGFGRSFEAVVAAGLAEFAGRLERACNRLWLAALGERIVGTVAIDGEDMGPGTAHLRWFIVDDDLRGEGVGRRLLWHALAFCDRQGFRETHLWTFRGLDAARHLYEAHGFALAEERPGSRWGTEVMEQRFVRPAEAGPQGAHP